MNWKEDVFTIDNLLHFAVALAAIVIMWLLFGLPILGAFVATIGLYIREVLQVRNKHGVWSFTLLGSLHKNLEWGLASFLGFVVAVVLTVI